MRALHRDPDATVVLGRQPEVRHIAPSKTYPWYGFWEEGHRFSVEQERALIRSGADPVTAPSLIVKRQARHEEYSWPFNELPPRFEFECPVIGRRGEKVKVIAPNGDTKLVFENGWSHRPYRQPRDSWGVPA